MLKRDPDSTTSGRPRRTRIERALRVEWLGQTAASLCWLASVFTYGIESTGDLLQLFAASAWLLANIAAIVVTEPAPPGAVASPNGNPLSSSARPGARGQAPPNREPRPERLDHVS